VLAEIAFGEGDGQSFDVDLERLLLKYDYNDHLRLSLGRLHTGIGYYNSIFESGKWRQTTADRPLVMEFPAEGGLLPTQAIGVSVSGQLPSEELGLNYLVEYGSSDTIRLELDGTDRLEDEDSGNHLNFGVFARPDFIQGLQVGTSFFHDNISGPLLNGNMREGQTAVNAHVVYLAHGIEILNEGFLIRRSPVASRIAYNMPAFYSLLSKRFGNVRRSSAISM